MIIGVDVGGTFTDAVLIDDQGTPASCKVLTTAHQADGVMLAIRTVLASRGAAAAQVERVAHGTTTATNALLERRGAHTCAVLTEGFTDLLHLGRQSRPSLFGLGVPRPEPLVSRSNCVGIAERTFVGDIPRAPTDTDMDMLIRQLRERDPEAVAICLLNSYDDPTNERLVAQAIATAMPDVHVVASHHLSRHHREFERASTTTIDAAMTPVLAPYLNSLSDRLSGEGFSSIAVMQSHGGLDSCDRVAEHASRAVLSGPAGGCVATATLCTELNHEAMICFDMGGTSCDVAWVDRSGVAIAVDRTIGGLPLQLPVVDMHTIGAGGSSHIWIDDAGAIAVGPGSAGSIPGPACYGHGGERLTITDAHLIVGNLQPDSLSHWNVHLDIDRSLTAARTTAPTIDPYELAQSALDLATVQMAAAVREISAGRGHDPASATLLAYGGAGGLHACDVARHVGCHRVLLTPLGGVLSAVGLAIAPRRREVTRSFSISTTSADVAGAATWVADTAHQLASELNGESSASVRMVMDCRYAHQSHTHALVEQLTEFDRLRECATRALGGVADRFTRRHLAASGFVLDGDEIVIDSIRVEVSLPAPKIALNSLAVPRALPNGGHALDLSHGICVIPGGWSLQRVGASWIAEMSHNE